MVVLTGNVVHLRELHTHLYEESCGKLISNTLIDNGGDTMFEYKHFLVDENLNFYSKHSGRKLKPHVGSDGYMQVECKINGKLVHERCHVIVGHCMVDNPNGFKYIDHKDGDKTNYNPSNLQWCTNSYNTKKGYMECENHLPHRISIYYKNETYKSIRECCKHLSLDRHKVARIIKGELPNDYLKDMVFDIRNSNDYRNGIIVTIRDDESTE